MKTTWYFDNNVMLRRPYLKQTWIEEALRSPVHMETQANGRIRFWVFVPEHGKYLRVVTEADGETVHNAFLDRGFRLK